MRNEEKKKVFGVEGVLRYLGDITLSSVHS